MDLDDSVIEYLNALDEIYELLDDADEATIDRIDLTLLVYLNNLGIEARFNGVS